MKKANKKKKIALGAAQDSPQKSRGGESKKLTRGRAESLPANPAKSATSINENAAAAKNPAKNRAAKRNPTATPRHAAAKTSKKNWLGRFGGFLQSLLQNLLRDFFRGKNTPPSESNNAAQQSSHAKSQESAQKPRQDLVQKSPQNAAITARLKAFLTDIFMIYAPILYVVTYVVLGSKEAFLGNEMAHFACFALFGVASSLFFAKTGQTPGYKYAQIALFNERGERVGFALALLRFIVFCASMSLVFGLFVPFLRHDKRAFHDVVCRTRVLKCVNP